MASTASVRNQTGKKLGLFGTGQTLESGISADLDQAYLEVYGTLESKGLASWGTATTDVPNSLVEPVVAWMAGIRATRYAVAPQRYQRIMLEYQGAAGAPSAEDRLRALLAHGKFGVTKISNF